MKKFILLLALGIFSFSSCDTVDEPLKNPDLVGGGGGDTSSTDSVVQNVLLEEFTGVKCNNCPQAAEEAKRLAGVYGDQLIIVGIHAGNLAQTDPDHPKAFRTPEGTAYFNDFSLFGVPVGFINRLGPDNISRIKLFQDWNTDIANLVSQAPVASIALSEESYDPNSRELNVSGAIEVLGTLPDTDIYLTVILTENKIISAQTMPDKTINPNYEHNHVFRGTFNSAYGEAIDLSSGSANFTKSIVLDGEIVKENCEAIAYIYNRDNYEIIQAAKVDL
jgi:hypothetical protein